MSLGGVQGLWRLFEIRLKVLGFRWLIFKYFLEFLMKIQPLENNLHQQTTLIDVVLVCGENSANVENILDKILVIQSYL